MADILFAVATLLLTTVAVGLFAIFRRSADVDRMMAPQLVGTGGVAILLLLADATATPSLVDVALILALLAAFAAVAFVRGAPT
jgi:multicomponent Na+:H+ antiporter subunit F